MATTTWIKGVLDGHGIAYEERHHRVAFSAQEVAHDEHVSGHRMAKVVAILADERPVELVLPASRRVALGRVKQVLGAGEVRLASEAEMERIFTDCDMGAIPPLRHWEDVDVLVDTSMPREGDLVFQAGTHEDVIRLESRDWFALVRPRVESFSEPEHAGHRRDFTDRGDVGSDEWKGPAQAVAEESRRESGLPGGGKGRVDFVEPSSVYPGSGPYPAGEAELRTPADFVRGQVDETGREVEGGSGLIDVDEDTLLGGETPPPSGPPRRPS
jgi:Ala-tRNA(Pro) deacylase